MDDKKNNEASETPGPKEAATREDVGTAGTTERQEELTAAERDFVQADEGGEGDGDGPPRAADYEYGMGSGRPASEEGEGIFPGSSGAGAHESEFGKLLKKAEHLIHGHGGEKLESGSGSGHGK